MPKSFAVNFLIFIPVFSQSNPGYIHEMRSLPKQETVVPSKILLPNLTELRSLVTALEPQYRA